jgi:hypothetical protein
MVSRIWILGAPDPEMNAIEKILKHCLEPYVYTCKDGKRVHAGIAYEANTVSDYIRTVTAKEINFVECSFLSGTILDSVSKSGIIQIFDHHREGDFGFRQPPSFSYAASSIGQVLVWLQRNYELPFNEKEWQEFRMIAAADHCLMAAYQGKCPGVDPNLLMEWRIRSKAKYQHKSVEYILRNVCRAMNILRREQFTKVIIADEIVADFGNSTIPELPEAAAREGIAFLATVTDADGRKKRVLQCASEQVIDAWMSDMQDKLVDIYGDPVRGFCGGYLK